jgi:hypothetical protein
MGIPLQNGAETGSVTDLKRTGTVQYVFLYSDLNAAP